MKTNSPLLRGIREEQGMTQKSLALKSGLSLRAVKLWESDGGAAIRNTSLQRLASALQVPATGLLIDFAGVASARDIPRILLQQIFPDTDSKVLDILRRGSIANIRSRFDEARLCFEEALEQAKGDDLDTQAQIIIRLATVLDDAGRSNEALTRLEPLLTDPQWKKVQPWIKLWLKYHVALAHRRLSERASRDSENHLDHAERLLREVEATGRPDQRVAASHQLGCVFLVRARHALVQRERLRCTRRAKRYFKHVAENWRADANFREGYALARIADIAELEGDQLTALTYLVDALEVFARHDCDRYCKDVRTRLLRIAGKLA